MLKLLSGVFAAILPRRRRIAVDDSWIVCPTGDANRWTVRITPPGAPPFEMDMPAAAEIASFLANPDWSPVYFWPEGREQAAMWRRADGDIVMSDMVVRDRPLALPSATAGPFPATLSPDIARRLAASLLWAMDAAPYSCNWRYGRRGGGR